MLEEDHNHLLNELRDLADREVTSNNHNNTLREDLREARDVAVTWLHEACLEQAWSGTTFAKCCSILDKFLVACPAVRPEQAQLAAATCMVLAMKKSKSSPSSSLLSMTRTLLEYADGAVLLEEVKAWELLVLSKLGWNLETVTACDYLSPLAYLVTLPEEEEAGDGEDAKSSLVANGELICCLCLRDYRFSSSHPNALLAASAIAISSSPSSTHYPHQEHPTIFFSRLFQTKQVGEKEEKEEDVILKCLRLTARQLESCVAATESLLRTHLPHSSSSPANSLSPPTSNSSPPPSTVVNRESISQASSSSSSSPLHKLTSTPKSSREPLKEVLRNADQSRRALLMDAVPETETDKENNDDSAICTLNTTGFTASDCTKSLSPPSSASGATSKTSSPDSGASSGSPRSTTAVEDGTTKDEVGEIDRLLGTTRISPLAKSSNS